MGGLSRRDLMIRAAVGLPALLAFERPLRALADCEPVPAVVRDLNLPSYYIDSRGSIVDPAIRSQVRARTHGIDDWSDVVARSADAWRREGSTGDAECAFEFFSAWAEQRAFDFPIGDFRGEGRRYWWLAGTSLAWLKLRDAPGTPPHILPWLAAVARWTSSYFEYGRGAELNNNLAAWGGLALVGAGIAINSSERVRQGLACAERCLAQAERNGTLPTELLRGRKALSYHLFSVAPLVALAELADRAKLGVNLYADGKLHRLAERSLAGYENPSWFAAKVGVEQDDVDPADALFTWVPVYRARYPGPVPTRLGLLDGRCCSRLGGELALLPRDIAAPFVGSTTLF